jgi:pimeloyl-ACP methyl ester carboxylesterase
LRGIVHTPKRVRRAVVILQGYFSSTHVGPARLYVQLARQLAARGAAVLRADCLGSGDADGDMADATFSGQLRDYRAMIADMVQRFPDAPLELYGHSLGGNLALRIAAEDDRVTRALLISPTCGRFLADAGLFAPADRRTLAGGGRVERKGTLIDGAFWKAIEDPRIYAIAERVRQPVVVVRGERDEYHARAEIERLLRALPDGRLLALAGGDHNVLRPGMRARLLAALTRLR